MTRRPPSPGATATAERLVIERVAVPAMGTRFEAVLIGDDPVRLRCAGEAALERIQEWEARLSRFDRGSFLAHLNEVAAERPVPLDDETFELLCACEEVAEASGGAFDVTMGGLMDAWGFRDVHAAEGGVACATQASKAVFGWRLIDLDRETRTIAFRRPGLALDLGAIGKGHALDDAAALLREAGITRALLHGGTSTVIAIGAPPGHDGWRVAIGGGERTFVVSLCDRALSVSQPSGRSHEVDGAVVGHVIDPRDGQPAARADLAAVVGVSARATDAWSTALIVHGTRPAAMPASLTSLLRRGDSTMIDGVDGAVIQPSLFDATAEVTT